MSVKSQLKQSYEKQNLTLSELFIFALYTWITDSAFNLFALLIIELKWAPSSEFVSSSIPSWHISTAHTQPFRGARDLAFCLKVPFDSLLVWASSEGSGETARMRRLAWTFAARIDYKYQIRLTRPNLSQLLDSNWISLSHVVGKPVYAICEQQKRRSSCTFLQSDQCLCCPLPG